MIHQIAIHRFGRRSRTGPRSLSCGLRRRSATLSQGEIRKTYPGRIPSCDLTLLLVPLSWPHPGTAAVLVDELHARHFGCATNGLESRVTIDLTFSAQTQKNKDGLIDALYIFDIEMPRRRANLSLDAEPIKNKINRKIGKMARCRERSRTASFEVTPVPRF